MRILRNLLIYILISFIVIASGCSRSNTKIQNSPAKKTISDQVEASGIVTVSNIENIVLDFQAGITNINVKEGQKLKKGDVILSLDLSDINSQISEKKKEIKAEKENASILQDEVNSLQGKLNKPYLVSGNIVCDIDNAVIKDISYKKGDIITPSLKIGSLLDLSSLIIEAKVDEQFIKDVQIGRAVTITPAADESRKYTGKVQSISSEAVTENGDTYIPVMISIDNKDGFLKPNYNVDLEISKK